MDLTDPTRAVSATLDGPVLAVLAQAGKPLTVGAVAAMTPRGSEIGVRRSLARLVEQGIVRATEMGRNPGARAEPRAYRCTGRRSAGRAAAVAVGEIPGHAVGLESQAALRVRVRLGCPGRRGTRTATSTCSWCARR